MSLSTWRHWTLLLHLRCPPDAYTGKAGAMAVLRGDPLDDATRKRMQRVRREGTKPELALRKELHRRGRRFYVQRAVLRRNRRADLVFPRRKVAVYVDGCFWHSCPEHGTRPKNNADWWAEKLERNVERDRATDAELEAAGWTVVRVWEHESAGSAADRIERYLPVRSAG